MDTKMHELSELTDKSMQELKSILDGLEEDAKHNMIRSSRAHDSLDKTLKELDDAIKNMDNTKKDVKKDNLEWWDNFRGHCVACIYAQTQTPPRHNRMLCCNDRAFNYGLPLKAGGTRNFIEVHKMYGCVYFSTALKRDSQ